MPRSLSPMLATLSKRAPTAPDGPATGEWVYERKLDGQRILAYCEGADVRLRSRTDKSADGAYPEIVDALHDQVASDCLLDGEVVAFDGPTTSFSRLQGRMGQHDPVLSRRSGIPVFFYVFDIVHLDGIDLTGLPLRRRKSLIRAAVRAGGPIRLSPHRRDGVALFEEACAKGWEGVIAKRIDSTYQPRRSTAWLKHKCEAGQELVIGGWTEPRGSRSELGAILVGHFEGDELVYAGKVGTGFDERTLRALGRQLRARARADAPFRPHPLLPRRDVHWVEPDLVCQVGFAEWTGDGLLRHPRYQGLRDDKPAREVVRER
ncbi:ATP-dependent DNA ligase [Actinomarinicola tropica]|uniref:DNA ligase (ATP) n=2 Tax=Actinomarinicola tropica TaxID=2789776 RepID=A0A5Q2RTA7_9ACTN|nr:ATP-dependent DNA ligase [Actinomarinicola tropica]